MQLRKARKRLTITDIDSVGGVDEGDNPGASLLFHKRKTPVTGDVTKGVQMDEQTAEAPAVEAVLDVGKQIEAEVEAETAAETLTDEIAKAAAVAEIAKAVQERDAAIAERDAAAASLAEEVNKRLDVEWVEKARPFSLLLGSPEQMGPALRKIAQASPDEYGLLEAALHAALGRVELAKILGEVGENTGQTDPISQRDMFVKDMRRLHPEMTVEACRAMYWKEHPEAVKASREGV